MSQRDEEALRGELDRVRARLAEAEQTLDAIRAGEVDSILVDGPGGPRVYALDSGGNSYRVLVEAMSEGAATLTRRGVILYSNERLARMLGQPLPRVMGAALREFVPARLQDALRGLLRESEEGESRREIALLHETGEEIPCMLSVSTIDRDGQPTVCLVATDLRAERRTQELVAAQEALREADRRKNEFLGVLSHELRNPLTPIRNSIYILDRTSPDSPQAQRAREVIRRQTEHLAALVDELLDVTRISHGKVTLDLARIDLREVARQVCDDHGSLFTQGGIELRVELAQAPVWIDGDRLRLAQVTGNLVQNAVKFTPHGGRVDIQVREREGRAELSVRDTGIGLAPQEVERMFEPFAQADRSLARTRGGLGLGLSLVRAVTELHGGSVRARSEGLGHGTEFVVTLPLCGDQPIR